MDPSTLKSTSGQKASPMATAMHVVHTLMAMLQKTGVSSPERMGIEYVLTAKNTTCLIRQSSKARIASAKLLCGISGPNLVTLRQLLEFVVSCRDR
jgi:hypothetical protein